MKKYKWPKYWKTLLTSLGTRKMQIETVLIFHLTPCRMAIIEETKENSYWPGCRERGTLLSCWGEWKLV